MNKQLYEGDPRDYAWQIVKDGLRSADTMLLCCLKYMSHDDVRDMLDCNELSPRFRREDEVIDNIWDEDENEDEDENDD